MHLTLQAPRVSLPRLKSVTLHSSQEDRATPSCSEPCPRPPEEGAERFHWKGLSNSPSKTTPPQHGRTDVTAYFFWRIWLTSAIAYHQDPYDACGLRSPATNPRQI